MNEFDLVYDMTDEPTLQEFQLAVQAELVKTESIPDKEERIKRQTQIEITLNELLKFRKKYSELKRLGLDPFREIKTGEDEPLKMSRISQTSVQDIGFSGISCTKCSAPLEQDLDFCSSCGKER